MRGLPGHTENLQKLLLVMNELYRNAQFQKNGCALQYNRNRKMDITSLQFAKARP